tara:strand:+ start:370 stop:708 length:339 start_codon:yes stop_codon:yes gene_type:complete
MKNIFLFGGILAILMNSLAGIVLSSFPVYNWILADISILFSTGFIFVLYTRFLDNAFKIAFTLLFLISGLIRYVLSLLAHSELENNWVILFMGGILFIEVFLFIFGVVLRKK